MSKKVTTVKAEAVKVPKFCVKCPHHLDIADPDPHDWFCDDDRAIVCTLVKNRRRNKEKSKYQADRSEFKTVSGSCRPYEVSKVTPASWCPLLKAGAKAQVKPV